MTKEEFIEKHIEVNYKNASERDVTIVKTGFDLGLKFTESQFAEAKKEIENRSINDLKVNERFGKLESLLQQSELENKQYVEAKEKQKLIHGEPCKTQCFDCIAIVGKTRIKNQKIRDEKIK